jgi:hypothetical protein
MVVLIFVSFPLKMTIMEEEKIMNGALSKAEKKNKV